MEKDKSKHIKHFKDKRKYKDNTTKNPKCVPPKQHPKLGSNWDRYDKIEENLTDPCPSTDFSILANAPVTKWNRFQLKEDKIIVEETKQNLFTFDIGTLHDAILTVPFYKRIQMDEKYFSENQLNSMRSEAKENLERYNKKYNKTDNLKQNEIQAMTDKIQEIQVDKGNLLNKSANIEKQNVVMEPKQMSNVATIKEAIVYNAQDSKGERSKNILNENLLEEDLDKWLDDVLAD